MAVFVSGFRLPLLGPILPRSRFCGVLNYWLADAQVFVARRYSARSAVSGSTREARQAGTTPAHVPARNSATVAARRARGVAWRQSEQERFDQLEERHERHEPGHAAKRDEPHRFAEHEPRHATGAAPSAKRTPISFVRRATEYDTVPNKPKQATITATTPKTAVS